MSAARFRRIAPGVRIWSATAPMRRRRASLAEWVEDFLRALFSIGWRS